MSESELVSASPSPLTLELMWESPLKFVWESV